MKSLIDNMDYFHENKPNILAENIEDPVLGELRTFSICTINYSSSSGI